MRPLQSLTLEAMIEMLSSTFGHIPDTRHPERVNYSLHDTLMSGFAMMFFQHPSLLEFQRKMKQRRSRCNLETIFGVHEVPSDTQMRDILDGVPGESLRQVLPEFLQRCAARAGRKTLKARCPVASIKATTTRLCSTGVTIFTRPPSSVQAVCNAPTQWGEVHFRHTVVSATLVKAGSHRVLPLDVEEVRNSDGQDKQDCEINAAKRFFPVCVRSTPSCR